MSTLGGLYRGESAVDFPRLWRRALIASTVAVLIGLASFGVRGLNLGLDFEGGTSFEVRAPGTSVADARRVMERLDAADARIQIVDGELLLIRSDVEDPARAAEIRDVLVAELGPVEAFEQVGPTWGDEVTDKAVRALLVFFVVVALYIAMRLEWKMAVGAMVAVAHDIVVPVPGLGIDRLADCAEQAQGGEIAAGRPLLAFADESADRGRRGVELVHLPLVDDLPVAVGFGV